MQGVAIDDGPRRNRELFLCATEPPERALERWRALLPALEFEQLPVTSLRLLPLVLRNLGPDFPEAPVCREQREKAVARNLQLGSVCRDLVASLRQAGLDVLVLKGLHLTHEVYRDPGLRYCSDLDLLVRPEQVFRVSALLLQLGWQYRSPAFDPAERLECAVDFHKDGSLLDLHWNLLREARRPNADDEFWRDQQTFDLDGTPVPCLSKTHLIFMLLVAANRETRHLNRYLYDLRSAAVAWRDEIDTAAIERLLRERSLVARAQSVPLAEIGCQFLAPQLTPTWWDRAWSQVTRCDYGVKAEWAYALYPLLDYWQHFRGQPYPDWSFPTYLAKRLRKLDSTDSLATRAWAKLKRSLKNAW